MSWLGLTTSTPCTHLDVAGGDGAFLVHARGAAADRRDRCALNFTFLRLSTMSVTSSTTPGRRVEFVVGAVDLHGGDGGAFEGAEQHAAKRVADGVAVTGLEGLGDEFGVGICGVTSSLTSVFGISKRPKRTGIFFLGSIHRVSLGAYGGTSKMPAPGPTARFFKRG